MGIGSWARVGADGKIAGKEAEIFLISKKIFIMESAKLFMMANISLTNLI